MFHISFSLDKWNFEEPKTTKKNTKNATLFKKKKYIYIRFRKWLIKKNLILKKDNIRFPQSLQNEQK